MLPSKGSKRQHYDATEIIYFNWARNFSQLHLVALHDEPRSLDRRLRDGGSSVHFFRGDIRLTNPKRADASPGHPIRPHSALLRPRSACVAAGACCRERKGVSPHTAAAAARHRQRHLL
jgi:hypothetical protein